MNETHKGLILIISGIVGIFLIFLYWSGYLKLRSGIGELPSGFPEELVMVRPENVTQSFQDVKDNIKQLSYGFETSGSLDELFALYISGLEKGNWQLESNFQSSDLRTIVAKKGADFVSIRIFRNSVSGKSNVVVIFITQ